MKLLQEQLRQQEEEEEVTFITDTTSDQSLQQDYIPLVGVGSDRDRSNRDDDDSSTLGLKDSLLYDSNKDYSWYRRH
jgi:hypothetical protein